MDFTLPEEVQLIQDTAREFARNELVPRAKELDRAESFPRDHWKKLAELGFLGFLIPEVYGGLVSPGFPHNLALTVALEELNFGCAATGVTVSVQNSLVGGPLVAFGSEATNLSVYGQSVAELAVKVFQDAGEDINRRNVIEAAEQVRDFLCSICLGTINLSPTDHRPIETFSFAIAEGPDWVLFGDLVTYESTP